MISNLHRNIMGTVSFDGQFDGMRKVQDFIVYPMKDAAETAKIQSDTRIGAIDMQTGVVVLSKPHSSGAYFMHMMEAKPAGKLSGEELLLLKASIFGSASAKAGTNGIIYTDNSAAAKVFG